MKKLNRIFVVSLVALLLCTVTQSLSANTGKININTATKEQLVALKYVGDKLADKIIEYRKAHPFQKKEDVMQVKGVGQKIYDVNKDLIIVKDE